MNRKSSFANVVFSILIGLVLIVSAINPISVRAIGPETDSPTETPVVTPTVTPEPEETPVPVVTSTPDVELPVSEATVSLTIEVEPEFVKPGQEFVLAWSIEGVKEFEKDASLRFYASPGFTPLDDSTLKADDDTLYLEFPVTETAGKSVWMAEETAMLPAAITAEFWQNGEAQAKAEVELPLQEEFAISTDGGELTGLNEQVQVTFPAGALSEAVTVKVNIPSKESLPIQSLSGAPFEITAISDKDGVEISEFSKPVEIKVLYSEAGMSDESATRLFWYDPVDGQWKPPLSQSIDIENNIITATTDHFTVFDTYNSNWQTPITPTMEYFQHSGFTGAASYSLPISVPPGPGGFQPSLALSYSSSVVDNVSSQSQASWVGMGWSMDAGGYIEKHINGTGMPDDDSYQLNLNGAGITLYPGTDEKWHASEENFYRVEFDLPIPGGMSESTWTIWDKSGTRYFFDTRVSSMAESDSVWRWYLTRAENIHGQEITYTYFEEMYPIASYDDEGHVILSQAVRWVYPETVTYDHGRYRIWFERIDANETGHRLDYDSMWTNPYTPYTAFQRALLDEIRVEHDTSGNGTWEIIRKYKFEYCQQASCSIFPDYVWSAGGRTPTLTLVQEFGVGGTQSLPAYTFTYNVDHMHLSSASNGHGGSVTFTYDAWQEEIPYDTWDDSYNDSQVPDWGNPLTYYFQTSAEFWTKSNLSSGLIYNSGAGGSISIWGEVQNANYATGKSFQLGRWYQVVARAKRDNAVGTHTLKLGFGYKDSSGVTHNLWQETPATLSSEYQIIYTEPIFLPMDATQIIPKMYSTGVNRVDWYLLVPVPMAYRVTSRTLAASTSYTYTYDYEDINNPGVDSASTNSPEISDEAAGDHPYVKPYTEFRGNKYVTETSPYGGKTVTQYIQNDCAVGRPEIVTIKDASNTIVQRSTSSYECTPTASTLTLYDVRRYQLFYPLYSYEDVKYDDLVYRWVRTTSATKDVYQANGTTIDGTLTTNYTYDDVENGGVPLYGNLIEQTVSGDVPTLTTHFEYLSNPGEDTYIVDFPAHTWVTKIVDNDPVTLAESFNLYEFDANDHLTGATTRTLLRPGEYGQTDILYDEWGNVTETTAYSGYWTGEGNGSGSPSGARTMTAVYDSVYHTYPVSMTTPPVDGFPSGLTTTLTYNYTLGVPTTETGPNGLSTKVYAYYDNFGRLIKLVRPPDTSNSPTLQITYSNYPFTVTLTQKVNETSSYTVTRVYDGLGQLTSVTAGGVTGTYWYGYDGNLRVDKAYMPDSATDFIKTTYDSLGRPSTLTAPDGNVTLYGYNGLLTSVTDANGNTTSTETDILGRTKFVDAPTGPDVTFGYDDLGNLKTAERGGSTVTMDYDIGGRKTEMNDPDMGNWTYDYDALGNLTTQVDARLCTLTMTYDNLSRLDTKVSSGTNCGQHIDVDYNYDEGTYGIGQRTSMDDGTSQVPTSWEYDVRGRLVTENKRIGQTPFLTQWTYNSADLPETMTYPDGETVTYYYNDRMLFEKLVDENGTPSNPADDYVYVDDAIYDSAGRITERTLGNGLTQTFGYYDWEEQVNGVGQGGRLETLVTGTLQNLAYQYDAVGNVKQITDSMAGETSTYQYDELNRLRFWTLNSITEEYSYDEQGNLDVKNELDLEYEDLEHVHAVTHIGSTQKYWYDENGNQTTRIYGPDTYTQIYDAENRMIEVKKNGETMAQFTYNGDGQKVKSVIDGETTYLVNGYYEMKGSEVTKYYFAGASRIAMRKYTIPQTMRVEYFLGDHLGSTSITTDMTGAKVSEMRYKPWGEVRYHWVDENLSTTPDYQLPVYTFTGQRSYMDDPSTTEIEGFGLMDYNARMYDPQVGRFVSADTVVPGGIQGLDRYSYTANNPVRYIDPSGHKHRSDYQNQIHANKVYEGWAQSLPPCSSNSANNHYCVLPNGIIVDMSHFNVYGALDFWNKVLDCYDAGKLKCTITMPSQTAGFLGLDFEFTATYTIDLTNITSEEELARVAGGVWWDYQVKFEEWERSIGGGAYSTFRGEDIPSQYLAFIAAVNMKKYMQKYGWSKQNAFNMVFFMMFSGATPTKSGVQKVSNYSSSDQICVTTGYCDYSTPRTSSVAFKVQITDGVWGGVYYSGSYDFIYPLRGSQYFVYKGCSSTDPFNNYC